MSGTPRDRTETCTTASPSAEIRSGSHAVLGPDASRVGERSRGPEPASAGSLTANALDVEHLSVGFGATRVIRDLTFHLERGASLAVIGPNGSGKTVLFKALIGAIAYDGVVRWAPGTRIGYVPQKLDLERNLPITGLDFLRARAAMGRRAGDPVAHVLKLVGFAPSAARQRLGAMSGGHFQRLLIGFALLGDPNVLLLDEPTAGVDEPGQEQLNELIRRLQHDRRLTVLFISHELSVVFRYATQVLCLGHGRAYIGPPRQMLTPGLLEDIYGTQLNYHVHDH